jgi:hypothetical protein
MNISKQEVQESLTEIENVISQTRKEIATGSALNLGVIWSFRHLYESLKKNFESKIMAQSISFVIVQ